LRWQKSKIQTSNAPEDVEEQELSFIVGDVKMLVEMQLL
jgi:hypothetical protein